MKLVSIIIPVYNGEHCLGKAIESCLSQTYGNIEIVLINDGSTDSSAEIAKSYAEKDKRIVLQNQKNSGPAVARNTGLNVAKGEYIQFLDSDDTLEKDCLSIAVDALEKYPEAGFLIYGFNIYSGDKLMRKPNPGNGYYTPENKYSGFRAVERLLDSPCNKLYKKEYITKPFEKGRVFAEDVIFNYENLSKEVCVVYIENSLYNVQLNTSESVNKRYKKGKVADYLYACELIENKLCSIFSDDFQVVQYRAKKLSQIGYIIGIIANNTNIKGFKEELDTIQKSKYFNDLVCCKNNVKIHYRILFNLISRKSYRVAKIHGKFIILLNQTMGRFPLLIKRIQKR